MKHNASYNFISQKVLKATPCASVANLHIYFEEMKPKADFFLFTIIFTIRNMERTSGIRLKKLLKAAEKPHDTGKILYLQLRDIHI